MLHLIFFTTVMEVILRFLFALTCISVSVACRKHPDLVIISFNQYQLSTKSADMIWRFDQKITSFFGPASSPPRTYKGQSPE